MTPLSATSEALELLVASGDEGVRTKVAWICEAVVDALPHADLVAVWFTDEDLTLVHTAPPAHTWHTEAQPARRSSLALTFATNERVIVVVTVYSRQADAFTGVVGRAEERLGAVRGASRLDADLDLACLRRARLAPTQLRSRVLMDTALGMLIGSLGLSLDEAEDALLDAALAAGSTVLAIATQVVATHHADLDGAVPHRRERE